MTMPFWSQDSDDCLTDLLFTTNYSVAEIAKQMQVSSTFIMSRIKDLDLGWVKRYKGNLSRGQGALTHILRKLLPGEEIRTEEPIGSRLFLDIYCPKYNLGIEYHGRQHFEYVEHFHGDLQGFKESQQRDEKKMELCKDLGIVLVVFRYNDSLDEDIVYNRILDAIKNTPVVEQVPTTKRSIKGNAWYEARKQQRRDANRAAYREIKSKYVSNRI